MPDLMSFLTIPMTFLLSRSHLLAVWLGLAPASPGAWLFSLALLVIVVRTALLPLVIHGVRSTHARAHATPQLRELQRRYDGRRDLESLHRLRGERRRIHAEHGVSRWSVAPVMLQLPLVYALYRVVADLTAGHPTGALDAGLVVSAGAASLLGLHLTSRLGPLLQHDMSAAAALIALALLAAALTFVGQRLFVAPMIDLFGQPKPLAAAAMMMPWLSAVGVVAAVCFVPAGVVVYWVLNNAWTFAQQGLVWRLAPTPGSPAAVRRAALRDRR